VDGACETVGGMRVAYRGLVGKPEGRGHLENLGLDGTLICQSDVRIGGRGLD
jgi:hypothetical protein